MTEQRKKELSLTGVFAAFFFLQLTVLRTGNNAGEGVLAPERLELVYYALQVFVILGLLTFAALGKRIVLPVTALTLVLFCAGSGAMQFLPHSRLYLAVTFVTVFCLGVLGGSSYLRMSQAAASGLRIGRVMGVGCACAVGLQYLLQLWRGPSPLLVPVMALALALLAAGLLRKQESSPTGPAEPASGRALLLACLLAAVLLLLHGFYNGYIHTLQISSGYTDYNVYSWPRLTLIPCYLLFGLLGDVRNSALLPAGALCVSLAGLLNSVLAGNGGGTYWLNMCLFYCAVAASVAYYTLVFWRLAPGTKHPALWACVGRMLDSGMVLLVAGLHISSLPAPAVLALDAAALAAVILLTALTGTLSFSAPPPVSMEPEKGSFDRMRERYGLSPAEMKVLRELVLTQDKQSVIAQRLEIKVGTVQYHTTALYRKTGAATRSGLTELYHECSRNIP